MTSSQATIEKERVAAGQTHFEVYWVSGSPYSWRVLLTLEVKQLKYTARLLEASKGDHKKPEYLALNPRGKVPALKDGGLVLYESLAIMQYLERKHPEPAIFGRTASETGQIWRLISEFFSYMYAPLARVVTPLFFGKSKEKADDIRAAIAELHLELARLEEALGGSTWLGSNAISAADIAIYPFIKGLLRAAAKEEAKPLDLGLLPLEARYPGLATWMQRIEKLPGYERTYPPHWRQ
jgi:glutathione S-transferase